MNTRRHRLAAALGLLALASPGARSPSAAPGSDLLPPEARGRTVYATGESGRGAAGSPIRALAVGGEPVPATQLPCVQCHRADGRGGREAGALVPEVRWARLASPHGATRRFGRIRPPYDAALFARALRDGLDSAGEPLDDAMPRYRIDDGDVADLAAYLRVLGAEPEAGTSPDSIRVGSILPLSGALEPQGRPIAALLRRLFDETNAGGGIHGRRIDLVLRDAGETPAEALAAARELASGPTPVFACVANGGRGADRSVEAYLDSAAVPVVGPLGFAREGALRGSTYWLLPSLESSARAAARRLVVEKGALVRVLAGSSEEAKSVAASFAAEARRRGALVSEERLESATPRSGEGGLLAIFAGASEAAAVLDSVTASSSGRPEIVVSSVLLGGPPPRGRGVSVHVVSPPVGPGPWSTGCDEFLEARGDGKPAAMEMVAFAAARTLVEALKGAGREVTRDRLEVALEDFADLRTGVLPPIRFGPLRRDGARGALLSSFDAAGALVSSDWIDLRDDG